MATIRYGYKSLTLSKKSEMFVCSFEEEKLRRKWGSVRERNRWRESYSNELYESYDDPCITDFYVGKVTMGWIGSTHR